MSTTPKGKKVKKLSGRKPTLAPFVDGPFKLYASYKGKDYTAQVLGSGVIVMDEKEHATPSGAAVAITKKPTDGYVFWQFNKNDKRVPLNEIRGKESPLAAPKPPKAKKVKEAAA